MSVLVQDIPLAEGRCRWSQLEKRPESRERRDLLILIAKEEMVGWKIIRQW